VFHQELTSTACAGKRRVSFRALHDDDVVGFQLLFALFEKASISG